MVLSREVMVLWCYRQHRHRLDLRHLEAARKLSLGTLQDQENLAAYVIESYEFNIIIFIIFVFLERSRKW